MDYENILDDVMSQIQGELKKLKKMTKLEEKVATSQIIKNLTDSFASILDSTSSAMSFLDDDEFYDE